MILIDERSIKDKIYTIRDVKVMLDTDLAAIYGYSTKAFNQQVKNNSARFPDDLMFQLTTEEFTELSRSRNLTTIMQTIGRKGGRVYLPHAFTEQGIYMLMTVLKGELAVRQSLVLVRTFKTMRHYLTDNSLVFQRLDRIELKQLETDDKVNQLFNQLEKPETDKSVIFFKGQMWDATSCIEQILEKAEREIILIDSYVDRRTLDMLSRKKTGVAVLMFTSASGNRTTDKEINDFNAQYPSLDVRMTDEFHDRFLILDRKKMYHIGASIKDAGKKAFEISISEDPKVLECILGRLGLAD